MDGSKTGRWTIPIKKFGIGKCLRASTYDKTSLVTINA